MKKKKTNIRFNETSFNGNKYRYREVYVPGYGYKTVAGESLNEVLMNDDGDYVSHEARLIDEDIFCFVADRYLNSLSDKALGELVVKENT